MKKKNILGIIILAIFVAMIVLIIALSNATSVKEKSYDAAITLTASGDMEVTESWVYHYPSGYSVHYRDIAWQKTLFGGLSNQSTDTTSVSLSVDKSAVTVLDDKGNVIDATVRTSLDNERDERGDLIECDPSSSTCDSIFVRVAGGFNGGSAGDITFRYTYTVHGAVTVYDDCAELNWNLFKYLEGTLKKANVTITLPSGAASTDDILVWGHGTNNGNLKIASTTSVIVTAKSVKSDDALEIRLLMPTTLFSGADTASGAALEAITSYENALAHDTNQVILLHRIMVIIAIIAILVMAFVTYRVYLKYDKELPSSFDAPYLRELPSDYSPAEMSYDFYMGTINDEDFTATMLDLIRRKFITMDTGAESLTAKNPDYTLTLERENGVDGLRPHEDYLLKWIFGLTDGKTITLSQIENYGKGSYEKSKKFEDCSRAFKTLCKQEGRKHDFMIERQDKKKASRWVTLPLVMAVAMLLLGEFLMMVIMIAVAIAYQVYVARIKKRTQYGSDEFAKWSAFKRFLEDFGNMKDYPLPGLIVWEHYLVYATSLKCADKVMDQLKVRLAAENPGVSPEEDSFWNGYCFGRMNSFYRMNHVMTVAHTTNQTEFARYASSKMASGSGHGGGFSGGSSFGGGGGGGRSR